MLKLKQKNYLAPTREIQIDQTLTYNEFAKLKQNSSNPKHPNMAMYPNQL
jgi:hypothetical protein